MRKKGSERFFRECFFAVLVFLISSVNAQDDVSLNRKKAPRKSLHAGVSTPARDTTIARQPLFSILKQLNQSKGIYFLFSDKSFGEMLVKPVINNNRPMEQILEELLQFTGLRFKKINEKTFVIIADPALPENNPLNRSKPTDDDTKTTSALDRKGQLVKGRVTSAEGKPLSNVSV